ncbi:MAG: hypothetical protein IPQ08_06175 [Chitinophagaceae bacterium]|nr:hypothetical protein [Chitinophagaceae bacterium]
MSTSNQDLIQTGIVNGQGFLQHQAKVNNTTAAVKAGELVYWDASAHLAKPLDTDAHAATILGIALQPSAVSSSLDNSSAPLEKTIQVGYGVKALLKTTAAETYLEGDLVYIGADAQTILNTTGANVNPVGIISHPAGVSSVTGAAGVSVQVLVYSRSFVKLAN